MRALYLILPILCILAIAYRYYSAFIAASSWRSTTRASTPAHALNDGAQLPPDQPLGALRPPLRRHHRRRPADRPGAGGAVRLPARAHLDRRRRRASAGAVHDFIILCASVRRDGKLARRDRARRDRPGRRRHRRDRDPLHRRDRARRPGHRGGQCARRERRGARSRSACRSRSRSSWASTCTASARAQIAEATVDRRRAAARSRSCSGKPRRRRRRSAHWFTALASTAHRSRWRPTASSPRCCRCGCCSARATTSLVHEDRHHRAPRRRRHRRQPGAQDAGVHASSSTAAGRSCRDRSSRSCSSPSRAARSPASTR